MPDLINHFTKMHHIWFLHALARVYEKKLICPLNPNQSCIFDICNKKKLIFYRKNQVFCRTWVVLLAWLRVKWSIFWIVFKGNSIYQQHVVELFHWFHGVKTIFFNKLERATRTANGASKTALNINLSDFCKYS